MVAGFVVHETITVVTQNGNCEIQLCFGDITKLHYQDKVDVILISAFRGDYSATPTSVIGALQRNLGLNVRELARNKAEDLRNLYSCWWSHELPATLPYKRLLCFETEIRLGGSQPQKLVGDVFRCLVPVLNNQDGTVITPMLTTGDQGHDKVIMLKGMVNAAVNWMKAGLPLRKLKIVLYVRFEEGSPPPMGGFKDICAKFNELKNKYDMKSVVPKNVKIEYDVYLSVSKQDENTASSIRTHLQACKPDIRIFGSQQELNSNEVWQEDMYEVMIRCARVITVLSPSYLNSTSCVEQYNIALCCNRKSQRELLAPFYIEQIENMPTYMGLVQYIDCLNINLDIACEQLVLTLNVKIHAEIQEHPTLEYDVFISYCHRNTKQASQLRESITLLDPSLKVFFDTQELKTGTSWQQTLYHAIDGSKVLVALVTKEYLKSPVCREEFNLALDKHSQKNRELTLVPIFLDENVKDIPLEFKLIKLVNASGKAFLPAIQSTAKAIVSYLQNHSTESLKELFTESVDSMTMDGVQEHLRESQLSVKYPDNTRISYKSFPPDLDSFFLKNYTHPEASDEEKTCDIVLSFAKNDNKYAVSFTRLLKFLAPSLSVVGEVKSAQEMRGLLDSATKIVTFVSPTYTESHDCAEDFNIALCRHRTQKSPVIFPIQVHELPMKPTYFHAVYYNVATTDKVWYTLTNKNRVTIHESIVEMNLSVSNSEILALLFAARKLVDSFRNESNSTCTSPPRPVLSNIGRLIIDTKELNKATDLGVKNLTQMLIQVEISEEDLKPEEILNEENDKKDIKKDESMITELKEPEDEEKLDLNENGNMKTEVNASLPEETLGKNTEVQGGESNEEASPKKLENDVKTPDDDVKTPDDDVKKPDNDMKTPDVHNTNSTPPGDKKTKMCLFL
ncbi:uncharacterized protein [Antedon mediterranea]|uniref:uncharacterized protein n=1 Tax=Antedon mediterranea TaxID=105859 RepID=UPI003AF6C437